MSNESIIDKEQNYQRLFQIGGLPYIFADFFSNYYRRLKVLVTFQNNTWSSYLPQQVIEETLRDGATFYASRERFESYRREFDQHRKEAVALFEKLVKKSELSREDVEAFFLFASNFHQYYVKTEFFYTDLAYQLAEKDSILKENLQRIEHEIKIPGRKHMNIVFFGHQSYLMKLFSILSKQFSVDLTSLKSYSRSEILQLFDNKTVDEDLIRKREVSFIIVGDGKESIVTAFGEDAEQMLHNLVEKENTINQEIKGTIANRANKGIVRGTAKVFRNNFESFDDLNGFMAKMEKNDILITETTSPELTLACHKAAAIVTNQGGMLSHAAVISRELGIPCIVGTGNATEILKDGDVVEVDAELGVVRKIEKDNSSYAFVWSNYQPLYSLETNINGLANFRDIVWNRTNNIIQVMKNNTISCFHSAQDLEDDVEKGKLFLDQDSREKFVSDVELTCKKHKEFFSEVKTIDFSTLPNEEITGWFTKATYLWSLIMSYFRASQANPTKHILEELKKSFSEEAEMLITFPELDDANKELVDWQNLLKEEYSAQKLLAHAEKYPWIVAVHFTREDVLDTLTQKYNYDKHNFGVKDVIKEKEEVKEKQQRIISKNKNLQNVVLFLQKLTWSRMEIKSCWAGTDFYMIPLIKEISQRTGESVHDINLYYLIDEIRELLLSGRRLSIEEKENRKKCFVGLWKDGKTVYTSGEAAEKLARKELGELYSVPKTNEIKGTVASQGKKIGRVRILESNNITQLREMRRLFQVGDILITQMTQPNIIDIAGKAGAIVTDEGGMLSHAAIIAREFGVPCIVGTNVATKVLKDGDLVEVDAEKGIVRKIQ